MHASRSLEAQREVGIIEAVATVDLVATNVAVDSMYQENGFYFLDLPELIKVNQLIRNGVDSETFVSWYESINDEQKSTLIRKVLGLACQAGPRDEDILEGLARAKVEEFPPRLLELLRKRERHWLMAEWLPTSSEEQRLAAFKVVIEIFGIAEGRRFANEKKETCNHWWHRDLLNPLVVESIIGNRNFYRTRMKDDDELLKPNKSP